MHTQQFDTNRFFLLNLKCSVKAPIHSSTIHKHTNANGPSYLVLVQLAVLVLLLPLLLKGHNNETNKDVHHEERDDDDVDDEEDGDLDAVIVDGTHVLSVRVDGLVQ